MTLKTNYEDQVCFLQEYTNLEQEYHFQELSVVDTQVPLHPEISLLWSATEGTHIRFNQQYEELTVSMSAIDA